MRHQSAATANPQRNPRGKTDPTELRLIQLLRKLLRNRTNADRLRHFLGELNSTLTTAHIAQALERIEREQQAKAQDVGA